MPTVQVSARILTFPSRCACCLDHTDTTVDLQHTRTTGVRVLHHDQKTWSVPYCHRCRRHAEVSAGYRRQIADQAAENEAAKARAHARAWNVAATLSGVALVCGVSLLLSVIAANREGARTLIPVLVAVLAGLGVVGFVLAAIVVHIRLSDEAKEIDLELDRSLKALKEHINEKRLSMMSPSCACADLAAAYHGWNGSIHTFEFANSNFAEAFRASNAKKVVR
jgi:hypothetical protein